MKLHQAGSPRSGLRGVPQAYRYALDPTPAQERRLRSHVGAARYAWNWALTRVKARYAAEKKWYSAEDLHRLWNAEKKRNPELAWWSENSKCVYQEAFRNLDRALGDFSKSKKGLRKGRRLGFPRSKKKGRCRDSCRFSTGVMRCSGSTVTLPRLGTIRRWKPEILAYFHHRVTNAFSEGVTNKIKCIKRIGFGYRNFERFRDRVLVACL